MVSNSVSLTERTVTDLRRMIAASGLKPGEILGTEADLEKRLNVSRSVLREAISRLRGIGIVDSRQCVGLIITRPDPVGLFDQTLQTWAMDSLELQELSELRYVLEIGAVELACSRATDDQLTRLVELAEEFSEAASGNWNPRPIDDIELDFHRTILEASHNTMLTRMHYVLSAYFQRRAGEDADWPTNTCPEEVPWEHRAIAKAFKDRNVELSRALLSGHLASLLSSREPQTDNHQSAREKNDDKRRNKNG